MTEVESRKVCPACLDSPAAKRRCDTCNPSAAVGDRAASAGRRLRDAVTGTSAEVQPDRVVRRTRGTETVSLTPAQKAKLRREAKAAGKAGKKSGH